MRLVNGNVPFTERWLSARDCPRREDFFAPKCLCRKAGRKLQKIVADFCASTFFLRFLVGMTNIKVEPPKARLATMAMLRETTLPLFINPLPSDDALRRLFDKYKVPRFKTNPLAQRGGGFCYYSVAAVEKLFARTATA